jgi:hypothetical protein
LIEILKSEHEINRNICSPNNAADNGLLAEIVMITRAINVSNVTNAVILQVRLQTRKKKKTQRVSRKYASEEDGGVSRSSINITPETKLKRAYLPLLSITPLPKLWTTIGLPRAPKTRRRIRHGQAEAESKWEIKWCKSCKNFRPWPPLKTRVRLPSVSFVATVNEKSSTSSAKQ